MCLFFSLGAAAATAGPRGEQTTVQASTSLSALQASNGNSHLGMEWRSRRVANVDMMILMVRRRNQLLGKRRDTQIAKHRRVLSLLCKDTEYAVRTCAGRNRALRLLLGSSQRGRQDAEAKRRAARAEQDQQIAMPMRQEGYRLLDAVISEIALQRETIGSR